MNTPVATLLPSSPRMDTEPPVKNVKWFRAQVGCAKAPV